MAHLLSSLQRALTLTRVIGETTESYEIKSDNYTISLDKLQTLWEGKLEPVYPVHVKEPAEKPEKYSYKADKRVAPAIKVAKPKVLIPVFLAQTANTIQQEPLKRQALRLTSSL